MSPACQSTSGGGEAGGVHGGQVLEEMRVAVAAQQGEVAAVVRVRGAVDHLRSSKLLPSGQDAASLYTVEHVDLSQL